LIIIIIFTLLFVTVDADEKQKQKKKITTNNKELLDFTAGYIKIITYVLNVFVVMWLKAKQRKD